MGDVAKRNTGVGSGADVGRGVRVGVIVVVGVAVGTSVGVGVSVGVVVGVAVGLGVGEGAGVRVAGSGVGGEIVGTNVGITKMGVIPPLNDNIPRNAAKATSSKTGIIRLACIRLHPLLHFVAYVPILILLQI